MSLHEARGGRPNSRSAFWATALYSVLVVVLAFFGGYQLFGWARDRVVAQLPPLNSAAAAQAESQPGIAAAHTAEAAAGGSTTQEVSAILRTPPVNVLLLGTDERPDEGGPSRTDTIILLTLDQASQTAGMLSLPRDLWVPIPGFDTTTKINTAYGLGAGSNYPGGGPQLVMDTVSSFVGQQVPYYVRINFAGFEEIVDLIGGIQINVPMTIHDEAYPTQDYGTEIFHLNAGLQTLDGATALKYARTRNVDDDYGRSRRQQDVIRAVFDKVRSAEILPSLLANAPRLLSTLRNTVETNIPLDKLVELAMQVNENPPREIRQLVLDSRYGEETYSAEGAWILLPDRAKVRAAVNTFFTPPAVAQAESVAAADSNPNSVHIEVLNGAGSEGMAGRTRDLLVAQGWQVVSIGDADRGDYTQSVLINYGVSDAVIQQLSNALGMQPALASVTGLNPDTPVDVRIVLGQDLIPFLGQ